MTTRAQAADRIHSAAIHLLRFVRREDANAGVSAAQLSALSVLVFTGARTMTELADAEQVRPPTISRTVDELERQGLAERAPHASDRRVTEVRVTEKGRALLEEGRRRRLDALVEALAGASEEELAVLIEAAGIVDRAALGRIAG